MPTMGMGEKSLPLPGSSSSSFRRPRTYFPSNPSSSSSSSASVMAHLRSRTRLTNLAVVLILALTLSSLLLNASYYLSPSPSGRRGQTRNGVAEGSGEGARSIEETIERDSRIRQLRHLIMVPGHAIWTGHDPSRVEEDGQWVLEPMQRGGRSVRTFLRHVRVGVEMMKEDQASLLVLSGGATRPPPSPPTSEAQSYLSLAQSLDLIRPSATTPANQPLPDIMRVTTEEYALDSYENLLFSIARFKEVVGDWPTKVTVVGYGMKRRRFELLHARAIGWPEDAFDYRGIDDEGDTTEHYAGELKYGFTPFLTSPSGCHPPLSIKRQLRNPFARYHPYHTSNPELTELMEWCPPPKDPEQVGEDGQGMDVYPGTLPWRDATRTGTGGQKGTDTVWDRERY